MSPTLKAGDVVVVDTWIYKSESPKPNDIIIFKRPFSDLVLAKRLKHIRIKEGKVELFVEGDNTKRSVDSRRFGWVQDEFLVGKTKFVWFSFRQENRALLETK